MSVSAAAANAPTRTKSRLLVHGSVEDVIFGRREKASRISPAQFKFAIGAGAVDDTEKLGEMIIVEGKAYMRPSGDRFWTTESTSGTVLSPFAVGVTQETPDAEQLTVDTPQGLPFADLPRTLRQSFELQPATFAFYGTVVFREMTAVAVKKAPIDALVSAYPL